MLILILFIKIFNVTYSQYACGCFTSTNGCKYCYVLPTVCAETCTVTQTNTIYVTNTVTTTVTSTATSTIFTTVTYTVYNTVTSTTYNTVTKTATVTNTVSTATITSTITNTATSIIYTSTSKAYTTVTNIQTVTSRVSTLTVTYTVTSTSTIASGQTYTITSTVTTTSTIYSTVTNTQYTTSTVTTTSTITNYVTTMTTTTLIYNSIIYLQGILNINSINQTFYRSISFPVQSGNTIFYLNITNSGNATINNITLSFSVIGNSVILSYNNLPITTLNNITISSPLQPNSSLIIPFKMLVISPGLTDVVIKVYVNGQYIGYADYKFDVELGSSSSSLVVSENINYILISLAGILGLLLLI